MSNLTIIIPLLNEIKLLPSLFEVIKKYPKNIKYIFCDAGSTDGSLNLLSDNISAINATIITENLPEPSVLKTILLAEQSSLTQDDYVMIHPVDLDVSNALDNILVSLNDKPDYVISYKKYDHAHFILLVQSFTLNFFRVCLMKQFVWTNAPIFKVNLLSDFKGNTLGFLEDVICSDQLRKSSCKLNIIKSPVLVSTRRYTRDGIMTRFLGNIIILLLFRLRIKSISTLKNLYYQNNKK